MSEAAVAVEGLTKVFPVPFHPARGITAVRDLNLRVEPGEVYGLLGLNGSGKSTTLKIVLGLVSPTRGRTRIFGRDSSQVESREAVGFLPENAYFYKFLTGSRDIRNLIVDLKRRGVTVLLSSHLLSQVQEICDRVGILARGVLVREGRLEELVAIENRSELVLENASEALVNEIEKLAANSNAKLIERRRSTTSLERLFLEATKDNDETRMSKPEGMTKSE